MNCPSCKKDVDAVAVECPWCGVVLAKARERSGPSPSSGPPTPAIWVRPPPPPPKPSLFGRIAFALIVFGGAGWWIVQKINFDPYYGRTPRSIERISTTSSETSDFDVRGSLPIAPRTAAWNGAQMLVASRDPEGGVVLLTPDGGAFSGDWIPIVAPETGEDLILRAAAWNGDTWIGYTEGHWFDRDGWVFTVHDRDTLAISKVVTAPPLLGCLTWDGSRYWAATRKTSKYAKEEAFLYTIDREFQVQKKSEPPAWGCQGLAWDGSLLWMTDAFDGAMHVVNVGSGELITSYPTAISDLGGLVWDDRNIWVLDSRDRSILRLNPRLRTLWTGRGGNQGTPSEPAAIDMLELDLLRTQLRSDDSSDRERATNRLRILGLQVPYARVEGVGSPEEVLLKKLVVETRGPLIEATWHATFSAQFLASSEDCCDYLVVISGGSLPRAVEKRYAARTGDNIERNIVMASALGPGQYWIEFAVQGGRASRQLARLRVDL